VSECDLETSTVRKTWPTGGWDSLRTRTKGNKLSPQPLSSELKVNGFDVKIMGDYVFAVWCHEGQGLRSECSPRQILCYEIPDSNVITRNDDWDC
jgi:hypothetical protein